MFYQQRPSHIPPAVVPTTATFDPGVCSIWPLAAIRRGRMQQKKTINPIIAARNTREPITAPAIEPMGL